MGFLATTLADRRAFGATDAELIRSLIHVMHRVDGVVEPREELMAELFARSVPQLSDVAIDTPPTPTLTRKGLLEALALVEDMALRRQLYVICVEAALSSGDINESEDQYADHVRRALRLDDAFAKQVVEVVGCKYARALR